MARNIIPAAGAFTGSNHQFTTFLTQGRSLHPMQRVGLVDHSGFGVVPAASPYTMGSNARPAKATNLKFPNMLNTSIIAATRGSATHIA